jgi:DNA-binding transcriptional regulator PaaX
VHAYARGELVDDWRLLVRDDPDLPLDFLPLDFPPRACEPFLETHTALAEPARARFEELIRTIGRALSVEPPISAKSSRRFRGGGPSTRDRGTTPTTLAVAYHLVTP